MAVQEQSNQADTLLSFVVRVKLLSKELSWRKLMVWFATVALASVILWQVMPAQIDVPGPMVYAGVVILGGCAGFLASLYCLTVNIISRLRNYLLYAVAFSILGSGIAYQSLTDSQHIGADEPFILTLACLIASSLFLVAAHVSSTSSVTSNKFRLLIRSIVATLWVIVFPLVTLPYIFDSHLLLALTDTPFRAGIWNIVECAADVISTILVVAALFGNYRRFQESHDRIAILVCYVLVPLAFGLVFKLGSNCYFDKSWMISQSMWVCTWMVFFAGGAIENAFAHKEASERLSELEAMHEISWSLVGAGSFSELMDRFATTLSSKLKTTAAAVYLADENGETLEVVAASSHENYIKVGRKHSVFSTNRFPGFHTGHTARAFTSGETQIVRDVYVDVEFLQWRTVGRESGCAVSLPLVHHGKIIGVVNLYFSETRQFTPQRLNLFKTIVASATPAIENMCKHEQTTKQANDLDKAA